MQLCPIVPGVPMTTFLQCYHTKNPLAAKRHDTPSHSIIYPVYMEQNYLDRNPEISIHPISGLKLYRSRSKLSTQLAWCSGSIMDCHTTARGSISSGNGVKTELHVLRKGQYMGVPLSMGCKTQPTRLSVYTRQNFLIQFAM